MKLTAISLSPNAFLDDILLSLKYLFSPWRWLKGKSVGELEDIFKKSLGVRYAFSFSCGRAALYALSKSFELKNGDEVLLQAFTCVAVPEAVLAVGAKPIYVDIDETLNLDLVDLEKKITTRSRVVIIQHTFGILAKIDEILSLAKKHNLVVVEDCAHALGAEYKGRKVGTFGQASFFSFGRDKVVSSVFGGMVATNDRGLGERLGKLREELPYPPFWWVVQQLFHPLALYLLVVPLYRFLGLGKMLLVSLQKMGLLSKAVYEQEREGLLPKILLARLPNALAALAVLQIGKLKAFNNHRRKIANFYFGALRNSGYQLPQFRHGGKPIFLRFNLLTSEAEKIIQVAKKEGFILGDWYRPVIAPKGVNFKALGYRLGSCPRAEKSSECSLNLPTGPKVSIKDAERLVEFILKCRPSEGSTLKRVEPLKIAEIRDKEQWEDYVFSYYPSIFLQSWNWGEFHRLMGHKIFRLGVFKKDRLLGAALVVKEAAKRGTFLACPGGPLIDWKNLRLFGSLVRYLCNLGKKEGANFIRVRPTIFKNRRNLELFRQYHFRDAPTHMHAETTWELDLSPSENNLLSNMRKNTRYDIRRAAREGVKISPSKKLSDVETLYRLQMEAAKRRKFTPFSKSYLENELRAFRDDNQVRLFLAKFKGKILSVAMIIFYGNTAFYHHGASGVQPAKISSSHLLLWEAVREAKRRGCRIFNFWGIAPREDPKHPWAGLTFFKKGFGGQRVDYLHAQDLPLSPLYWLTYLFETARRLKRRL